MSCLEYEITCVSRLHMKNKLYIEREIREARKSVVIFSEVWRNSEQRRAWDNWRSSSWLWTEPDRNDRSPSLRISNLERCHHPLLPSECNLSGISVLSWSLEGQHEEHSCHQRAKARSTPSCQVSVWRDCRSERPEHCSLSDRTDHRGWWCSPREISKNWLGEASTNIDSYGSM